MQKENYERHHHVGTLLSLPEDQTVRMDTRGHQTPGQISLEADTPRSYLIETSSGELQQNQAYLRLQNNPGAYKRTSEHSYHNWTVFYYPLTACHSLTDRYNYPSPRSFTI